MRENFADNATADWRLRRTAAFYVVTWRRHVFFSF